MRIVLAVLAVALVAGCGSATTESTDTGTGGEQQYPDVVGVEVTTQQDGYTFEVTISSPYDSPERYADAFRARSPDGIVHGVRELAHDHASEQPFTRSLTGVALPAGTEVVIEARDLRNGWGGATRTVQTPARQ